MLYFIISQLIILLYITCDKRKELNEKRQMESDIESLKQVNENLRGKMEKLEFNFVKVQNVFSNLK